MQDYERRLTKSPKKHVSLPPGGKDRMPSLAGLLAGAEPPKGLPPSRGARGPSVPPVAAALLRTAGPDAEAATTAKPAASNAVASRETAQASAAAGPQSSEMARCVPCHAPVVWELGRGYIDRALPCTVS